MHGEYIDDIILETLKSKAMSTREIAKMIDLSSVRVCKRINSLRKYCLVERVEGNFEPKYRLKG